MIESRDDPARMDLGPLAPDAADSERIIGSVMARLASRPQRTPAPVSDVLEIVGKLLPTRWIAAAALLAMVGSSLAITATRARPASPSADALIASWAERQHVPTNGELLLAFQGYQR